MKISLEFFFENLTKIDKKYLKIYLKFYQKPCYLEI